MLIWFYLFCSGEEVVVLRVSSIDETQHLKARHATSHFTVWGDVLCRVDADAHRLRRHHTPRSLREAFLTAVRSLGAKAPALRPFLNIRAAERLSRVTPWRA